MFGHRYKYIFPALLAIYSFLNILVLEGDRLFQAELPAKQLGYVIIVLSYGVWFINFGIEKYILPKPLKIHPLLVQFFGSIIGVSLLSMLSVWMTGILFGEPFSYSKQNLLLTSGFCFRINLFLNCLNAIYFFSKKFREKAVEAEKLQTLNMAAKLESLNAQLNPHFFFNNLSSLSVLIHEDVKLADKYLQKLSNIYRYILNKKNTELVSLKEELDFLKNYLDLLGIRFQQALSFKMEINEDCREVYLPPAVLQLLVENVVKHNYFTEAEPLEVWILANCDSIKIINSIQKKEAVELSTGIGLENIMDRYKFLGKEVKISNDKKIFSVELPLIKAYEDSDSRRRALSPAKDSEHYQEK